MYQKTNMIYQCHSKYFVVGCKIVDHVHQSVIESVTLLNIIHDFIMMSKTYKKNLSQL